MLFRVPVAAGRLAATLLLALSLVGVVTPATAQPAGAETAIMDVIQRGNAAQALALAARDPSPMAETAAAGYYEQLVRTNQNLRDQGVSVIELVGLERGPITVTGGTATATTFETWRTSYADGPTDFSRDRNVYTLVQDADGAWRVAANDHPDNRGRRLAAPPPPESPPPPELPATPGTGTSRNWSGYAARGGTFTSVSASWTVPRLALDGTFAADAAWVGIGGLRTRDLIQAGTQQTVSGTGTVSYQAWIEMLPDPSRPVPLTVLPGHSVNVSVDQQEGDNWLFSFVNQTTGQTLQRTVQYTSSVSSAEWIQEAPFARRRVLPISQFGTLAFHSASAVRDGQSLTIADLGAQPISLIDGSGRVLAVPSPLGQDGASFTVSRT
jgi:Peptidase A4 family